MKNIEKGEKPGKIRFFAKARRVIQANVREALINSPS
ncbi:hypothetical protein FHS03_004918 [Massilia violacea]|uniref:Uncharacterized protein n=1 Tax=Pseudoduganella violacea TaxID=1715466 RepID=A0A7W5BFA9_9BURK|nr:hypothetical protein [Pseudoduganella violacea]